MHHLLFHCYVVSSLWEIFFALVGVRWVFSKTIKEALLSWRGSFVGRKRKIFVVLSLSVHLLDGLEGEKSYSVPRREFNCIEF